MHQVIYFLIDDTEDADATNNHDRATVVQKKKITAAQMKKATEFVSGGGDIKAILAKYTMSTADLTALKKLVKQYERNTREIKSRRTLLW